MSVRGMCVACGVRYASVDDYVEHQRVCPAMAMPSPRRAARRCPRPGCPEVQPCPIHTPAPWEQSDRKGRLPSNWRRLRAAVLRRDDNRCYVCGGRATEVDHVMRGDDHRLSNLAGICGPCHRNKTTREAQEGRRRHGSWT